MGFLVLLLLLGSLSLPAQQVVFPLKPGSVRFAAIGDTGTGETPEYQIAARMAEVRRKFPFEFVLMVGDNVYDPSGASDYERKFERPYRALLNQGVKFYAVLGNHDSPDERFYKWFNLNGARYYTFTRAKTQFFALDSNHLDAAQHAWLDQQLRSSNAQWKICYFHHPLYSSAAYHGPSVGLRMFLEPLFVKYGVKVVLAGHDHVYERVKPQRGIYYFTEGASGQLRYGNLRSSPDTAAGFDKDRSFLLFEIAGDDLYFQAISRTGAAVDSGLIRR